MYCNSEEFVFIMLAVIAGIAVWKLTGSILKGIVKVLVKIGARVLRAEMKEIEIAKAIEKTEKEN